MPEAVTPVRSVEVLPARADVVVIGGGIAGVSTALFLARRGISVVLCEKGEIAAEQSSRNWGWCRTMGRDATEIPLSLESLRLWEGMNGLVEGETGFRRQGILFPCADAAEAEAYAAWAEQARAYQIESRMISAEEVGRLLPGSARQWVSGFYTPSDGRAEPQLAVPAMAEGARRLGAAILTSCAVRGVETAAGRVAAAITERGRIACDAVVLAGGAWSRLFGGNLGIDFPILKIIGSVCRTAPLQNAPEVSVGASNFSFRKRLDGGYTIARRGATIAPITPDSFRLFSDFLPALRKDKGEFRLRLGRQFVDEWRLPRRWALDGVSPFERVRVLEAEPNEAILQEGLHNLTQAFPAFKAAAVVERWAGVMDVTPDAVPVISGVATLPGFFIASGFSGHGFGIGPAAGHLMADLVSGDTPIVDPGPFDLARFRRSRQRLAA